MQQKALSAGLSEMGGYEFYNYLSCHGMEYMEGEVGCIRKLINSWK